MTLLYRGRHTPYTHQKTTAQFLYERQTAFCFNDIGTGKTDSAIWAMDNLFEQEDIRCALVIAPKSTLNHVWSREFFVSMPHLDVTTLIGPRAKRRRLAQEPAQVYIINPDGLKIVEDLLGDRIDLILIDESTAYKNYTTARHKTLRKLVKPHTRLWLMSGSPMPQQPTDIWAQAKLVCPDAVPSTFGRFKNQTMIQINKFKWIPKKDVDTTIAEMIKDYTIRFTRDECLDLPPAHFYTQQVDPTAEHTTILKELKSDALFELDDGNITAFNEGIHVAKMLQAACGGVKYTNDDGVARVKWVNCKPKLEALKDIIESTQGPVIVFSPFIAPLKLLQVYFKQYPFTVVHGQISQTKRNEAFDGIQNGKYKILFAQPAAMAHGITLTASNTIVWWGLPFSRETYEQACGRIIRAGQTRKQNIIHLVNSEIERIIYKRMQEHQALQGSLLELLEK